MWLLLQPYRRRLWAILAAPPPWLAEEVLSASQEISSNRAAVWLSEN